MPREIRITVDDDEVFERMKARKRELDLSWEEVLHRGLRREGEGQEGAGETDARSGPGGEFGGWAPGQEYHRPPHPESPSPPRDPISDPRGFAEDLKRHIQGELRESLRGSLDPTLDPLESEMSSLEAAEDAVLVFDFLGDEADLRTNQVPLRVTLEASSDGLAVDVVAVRKGKTVTDTNAFDPAVRRRVVEGLATGETATLRLDDGDGDEGYAVAPVLSWTRSGGRPTVASVSIEEVRFDGD